ncbi:hypothetical protein Daudx_2043 [Candidatus Desulforudis audaxviator]|nr:hypothetical protein Daudx_2043 [Candidatus Desulforudis audaxviator]
MSFQAGHPDSIFTDFSSGLKSLPSFASPGILYAIWNRFLPFYALNKIFY